MFFQETLLFASGGRSNYRIPSIVVSGDGTMFAFCNDRHDSLADHADEMLLVWARRRPGQDWEAVRVLEEVPGWACMIGSAIYDDEINAVMICETRKPLPRNEFAAYTQQQLADMEAQADQMALLRGIRRGKVLFVSTDGGEHWAERPLTPKKCAYTRPDGVQMELDALCHGSAHGVRLRHGVHAGRLIFPSRAWIKENSTLEGLQTACVNNTIYSDDHGESWSVGAPVQIGTGEGALMENADGSLTYNSRAYFQDGLRYLATSRDGGGHWADFRTDPFLREETCMGCNASLLRVERAQIADASLLPEVADGVTLFVNPRAENRSNMTVCISFDSGATWAKTKTLWPGACAYSSLDFSAAEQRFALLYERGEETPYQHGVAVAEFDLEWLLA